MINSLLKRELRLLGCLLIQYCMAFMPSSWLMFVYKLVRSKETNIVLSGTVDSVSQITLNMQSKRLDKDVYKVTESTRWTSRTSYYGPEFEICWPKNPDVWFLLDFSFLTNYLLPS